MYFMENLSAASFIKIEKNCEKEACRTCPWLYTCKPQLQIKKEDLDSGQDISQTTHRQRMHEDAVPKTPAVRLFPEPEILHRQNPDFRQENSTVSEASDSSALATPHQPDAPQLGEKESGSAGRPAIHRLSAPSWAPDSNSANTSNCERDICQALRSMADAEKALAQLLNAEAQKIRKTVETASSVEELLSVNKSVQEALTQAALLEQNLYLKLQSILSLQ